MTTKKTNKTNMKKTRFLQVKVFIIAALLLAAYFLAEDMKIFWLGVIFLTIEKILDLIIFE